MFLFGGKNDSWETFITTNGFLGLCPEHKFCVTLFIFYSNFMLIWDSKSFKNLLKICWRRAFQFQLILSNWQHSDRFRVRACKLLLIVKVHKCWQKIVLIYLFLRKVGSKRLTYFYTRTVAAWCTTQCSKQNETKFWT